MAMCRAAVAEKISILNKGTESLDISISYCEFHTTHKFAVETVREAYRRIGMKPKFVAFPCKRSLSEANSGRFSAEVARILDISEQYPNLIAAESPTITIEAVVVTKNIKRDISHWSDLNGLRIGIIRGEQYAERGTEAMNVYFANDHNGLLKSLLHDEIDVAIVIRRDFELIMRSTDFFGENIHIIGKPIFSAPLYHLVHKNNRELLLRLNPVFKEMWDSGETEAIHMKTINLLTTH